MTQLEATLEAILYAAGDAVPVGRLAAAAGAEPAQVAHALHGLAAHYAQSGSGIQLAENRSAEGSSLSLSVQGTLILPWNQPAPAEGEAAPTSDLDLGEQGAITGWGLVTLRGADGAYDSQAPNVVAGGALRIECAPDQSRLIQVQDEEG